MNEFLKYRPQKYFLEIDREIFEKEALVIAFANTKQYGNGAIIAPDANPEDGYLDVCIVSSLSFFQATQHVSLLFKGTINKSPFYFHKQCKSVKVHSDDNFILLHRDGEPDEPIKSLDVKIVEKALKVCVPF